MLSSGARRAAPHAGNGTARSLLNKAKSQRRGIVARGQANDFRDRAGGATHRRRSAWSRGPKEMPMNLPSNFRSLVAFGLFWAVGGAWLTFVTEARTRSLRGETSEATTSHPPGSSSAAAKHTGADRGLSSFPRAARAAQTASPGPAGHVTSAARPRSAPTDVERIATARRELEFLELQKPENFLAMFDMMKGENRGDAKQLEAARAESHRYIIARTKVLERMLRRFIDDPSSDQSLETDALARLDDAFRAKVDSFARDIPDVANVQEILTTTTLKAPSFTDRVVDEPEASNDIAD
jgi:hypothetical protein